MVGGNDAADGFGADDLHCLHVAERNRPGSRDEDVVDAAVRPHRLGEVGIGAAPRMARAVAGLRPGVVEDEIGNRRRPLAGQQPDLVRAGDRVEVPGEDDREAVRVVFGGSQLTQRPHLSLADFAQREPVLEVRADDRHLAHL